MKTTALILTAALAATSISTINMEMKHSTPVSVEIKEMTGSPRDESGIENGVSAAYAGMEGSVPVMAGGCNFPQKDPLAPDAVKRFYKGLYTAVAENGGLKWHKAAELPFAAAYGVSAPTSHGLFIAGGQTPDGSLADAMMICIGSDGKATLKPLSRMPATVDNAYAASDGNAVYVVGGNVNGKPSRSVLVYDIVADRWSSIPDMPGNPRVQPVAACSGGKLYVWGGFAGRHDGMEPTFELSGICYDQSTNEWTPVSGAVDADGRMVGLGGGVASQLPDGRILAVGGVNPDVFLSALTSQPADYLLHDPEWYRFNRAVLIYDPVNDKWTEAARSADTARAGAMLIPCGDGSVYLLGGEIKPRIRTPRAIRLTVKE